MPIRSRDDAAEVEDRIARFFSAQPDERPSVLRRLFAEVLDFPDVDGAVSLAGAPDSAELPDTASRIAQIEGVHVLYAALSETTSDRVNKREAAAAVKLISEELGDDLLVLFTNESASQLHFIHPQFGSSATPTLRRMVVERDLPRRTAVQQVSNIYWNHQELGDIRAALDQAFDVEPVTKEFFKQYKALFERAEGLVTGLTDPEERKQFVQTLFNRLMFVYFLSRKSWLTYEGETDYLNALWDAYGAHPEHDNLYEDRLKFLFFEGLNNPDSRDLRGGLDFLIGDVPFLNGGLFEETDLDQHHGIHVPDDAIRPLMTELFDRFNFTVMESTPFDIEVAVDPEMLGKVFEELITERHDSGAYYTPRPVVSFMCREALKGFLESHVPSPPAPRGEMPQAEGSSDPIARFVDEHDASGLSLDDARAISQALDDVTVVDPACGSGAYLVGMMQELVELQTALYSDQLKQDARSLYQLKLHIIERNLHGVDLDPFAVNIAMLRLWLSLAIEYEHDQPEPLPNLDFKILEGDSLLGPDPSETGQQGVLGYEGNRVAELRVLKQRYMTESDPGRKVSLREAIEQAESDIRDQLSHFAGADNALDWRIDFADVIAEGGFDIAIANPPYIQLQRDSGKLGNLYKPCGFKTFARTGDIYQLFYERGCQILQAKNGLLAYITSNSWLRAKYGETTRRYFAENHQPLRWLDLGKDVFESAIVDSGVLLLQTGGEAQPFPAVDMDAVTATEVPPPNEQWGETRPEGTVPWSVLSHIEWSVMEKMRAVGTPLKEWDIAINYGVKTGFNEAFIIDNETKEALVAEDPRSVEIIKPVLRGRDVGRYRADWRGLWLIATLPALDLNIDDYPAVKRHLLSFGKQRLEQSGKRLSNGTRARKRTGHAWFEMQDTCAYHAEFSKEKLFWMQMGGRARFAYAGPGLFSNQKAFMITGTDLRYLLPLLNSSISEWYMQITGVPTGMGLIQWDKYTVERLPIRTLSGPRRKTLEEHTDRVLAAKNTDSDANTTELEREIDQLVYHLYNLTAEEIASVELRLRPLRAK